MNVDSKPGDSLHLARVLVVCDSGSDRRLLAEMIMQQVALEVATSNIEAAYQQAEAIKPSVLVLAFHELDEAESWYLGLFRASAQLASLRHKAIVLCKRADAVRAFQLCKDKRFDDYVVFWPISDDPRRLGMAVIAAVRALQESSAWNSRFSGIAANARHMAQLEQTVLDTLAAGDKAMGDVSRRLHGAGDGMQAFVEGLSGMLPAPSYDAARALLAQVRECGDMTEVAEWATALKAHLESHLGHARAISAQTRHVEPEVLVVDDDEFQHRMIGHLLADAGLRLSYAKSASEAILLLRGWRPDLIMVDFGLPDTDGIELIRIVKANSELAGVPIILITGNSTREVAVESIKLGAVDFMVKPFDRNRLLSSIKKHIAMA
jgi:PleD family two-component response regulator